jgi:hypothetical protein
LTLQIRNAAIGLQPLPLEERRSLPASWPPSRRKHRDRMVGAGDSPERGASLHADLLGPGAAKPRSTDGLELIGGLSS